jgi:hypothetical protein
MMCGKISKVGYACVEISSESWAPGIWAGVCDLSVELRDSKGKFKGNLEVTYCDLNNKRVYHKVEEFPEFFPEIGDELHAHFYVTVENS